MKHITLTIFATYLALLTGGCGTTAAPPDRFAHLAQMPAFDEAAANAAYEPVEQLEVAFQEFNMLVYAAVFAGVKFSEQDKQFIRARLDKFIYFKALAQVAAYYENPERVKAFAAQAQAPLTEIKQRVKNIEQSQLGI